MFDLRAAIEPGKAAAGISIGDPILQLSQAGPTTKRELGGGVQLFDFGPVRVWVKGGVVDQIGVRGEYAGYVSGTAIGVGSTIQQVVNEIGPVMEDDEDNLVVAHLPGLCFETGAWRGDPGGEIVGENLDEKLTEIFVFTVQAS